MYNFKTPTLIPSERPKKHGEYAIGCLAVNTMHYVLKPKKKIKGQ